MMENEIGVVVLVLLLSFVIDRIVRIVLALACAAGIIARGSEGEKIGYFLCAALLAIPPLIFFEKMRVLYELNLYTGKDPIYAALDVVVTALILIGGADFLGKLIEMSGAYDSGPAVSGQRIEVGRQVHIRGTLEIVDEASSDDSEGQAQGRHEEGRSV